jgi:hypothetical protein
MTNPVCVPGDSRFNMSRVLQSPLCCLLPILVRFLAAVNHRHILHELLTLQIQNTPIIMKFIINLSILLALPASAYAAGAKQPRRFTMKSSLSFNITCM